MVSRNLRDLSSIGVVLMGAVLVAIWKPVSVAQDKLQHRLGLRELLGLTKLELAVGHAREFAAQNVFRQKFVQQDEAPLEAEERIEGIHACRGFGELVQDGRGEDLLMGGGQRHPRMEQEVAN